MASRFSFEALTSLRSLILLTVMAAVLVSLVIYQSLYNTSDVQGSLEKKLEIIRAEQREIKRAQIDLLLSQIYQKKLFNGNVLILEKGEEIIHKSYGFASVEQKTKLSAASMFRIGAISSSFTAMAVLKLIEQKKITLDDSLARFYPEMPYPKVTIRNLLTHTSGLPDYLSHFYTYSSELMTYARNRDIIAWLQNEQIPLAFQPNTAWEYSNSNYIVLAGIVEKISKTSFPQFLQKEIIKPLGLRHTFLPAYHQPFKNENRILGFQMDGKTPFDDNFLNYVYGGDGVYSSTEDLLKWLEAWQQDKLISKKLRQQAFRPVKLQNGESYPYGFAWYLYPESDEIYHLGSWLGFKSVVLYQPKAQISIILLSNNSCPVFEELIDILKKILHNERFRRPAWLF